MSNRRELRAARAKLARAQAELEAVEALPRRVGSRVQWSNGVIWTRVGDNAWLPWSANQPDDMPERHYESVHVATADLVPLNHKKEGRE